MRFQEQFAALPSLKKMAWKDKLLSLIVLKNHLIWIAYPDSKNNSFSSSLKLIFHAVLMP